MLTRKQYELLMYIQNRLAESGVSPSFEEMKEALGLKSKSGIHRLITGLEERGFVRRLPHRARALEILRLPENAETAGLGSKSGFSPKIISNDEYAPPPSAVDFSDGGESVPLPLYGKIAAGTPIEALRDQTNAVDIPANMLAGGDHYALEVEGDSMVEAGILDGDTVVIQRCETADTGAIVVALIDESEVTLKRLRRKGNSIALEPANVAYETRIFGPDRVKVQGRLIGLLRRY
ncbi:MAG: transcriptional repressor LexA [Alphaproteobacteria bacterium]|nr:transcriptional repressor LexA [Alphaproteobacteria bacterium]